MIAFIELAHRTCWRFKKSQDPHHSDTYTFNDHTLKHFVEAIRAEFLAEKPTVKESLTADISGRIADCLLEDHVALLAENKALREALDQHKPHEECECSDCLNYFTDKAHEEALAKQTEQEPVAWMHTFAGDVQINNLPAECYGDHWTRTPLYAAPVQQVDHSGDATKKVEHDCGGAQHHRYAGHFGD